MTYKIEKRKARSEKYCNECGLKIEVGEHYNFVYGTDGYITKKIGAFHDKCSNKFLNGSIRFWEFKTFK